MDARGELLCVPLPMARRALSKSVLESKNVPVEPRASARQAISTAQLTLRC